jgi:hypothetical protein
MFLKVKIVLLLLLLLLLVIIGLSSILVISNVHVFLVSVKFCASSRGYTLEAFECVRLLGSYIIYFDRLYFDYF